MECGPNRRPRVRVETLDFFAGGYGTLTVKIRNMDNGQYYWRVWNNVYLGDGYRFNAWAPFRNSDYNQSEVTNASALGVTHHRINCTSPK